MTAEDLGYGLSDPERASLLAAIQSSTPNQVSNVDAIQGSERDDEVEVKPKAKKEPKSKLRDIRPGKQDHWGVFNGVV